MKILKNKIFKFLFKKKSSSKVPKNEENDKNDDINDINVSTNDKTINNKKDDDDIIKQMEKIIENYSKFFTIGKLNKDVIIDYYKKNGNFNTKGIDPYEMSNMFKLFDNCLECAQGGFSTVFEAIWLDGAIEKWDYENQQWCRQVHLVDNPDHPDSGVPVVFKSLDNSSDISEDFLYEWETWLKGFRPKIVKGTMPEYVKLMNKCWNNNPDKRPTADELSKIFEKWSDKFPIELDEEKRKPVPENESEVIYHPEAYYISRKIDYTNKINEILAQNELSDKIEILDDNIDDNDSLENYIIEDDCY
ncbi:unnamed protein product [Rhizophagus irregularis]|uniref:Serine-threonine/tyrosine-protein kinase catalytic domain-containing protein n=1 Tax=Rhizophagus irregularis TaxID=588596 RepID=A0A916E8P7_9GLOM|nr:unnamed protein product [Rhizophagus irregularis]